MCWCTSCAPFHTPGDDVRYTTDGYLTCAVDVDLGRVHDVDRRAGREGVDLVEDVGELQVPFLMGDVADVGCAEHVVQRQQRVGRVAQRLGVEHVDGRHGRMAVAQGGDQRAG